VVAEVEVGFGRRVRVVVLPDGTVGGLVVLLVPSG
jgi:hypothetical protein